MLGAIWPFFAFPEKGRELGFGADDGRKIPCCTGIDADPGRLARRARAACNGDADMLMRGARTP